MSILTADGTRLSAHEDFEVFSDPAYYDMWCLRPVGEKAFNQTIHFALLKDAVYASHVVAAWMTN
ncbi:hypothetical protein [Roseibium sp. MMSF_3361]|uniref:hypothetical protein n=1 Tax=Roseibium sp. MMSF_3361 TaxID=3046708 RepID=UPI00273D3879|nr:hypothetical protein [Roseibium sp. MMSF_3361]